MSAQQRFRYRRRDVNNVVMELLITAYACKTSTARTVVGVIPYLPYSKQCRGRRSSGVVADLTTFGVAALNFTSRTVETETMSTRTDFATPGLTIHVPVFDLWLESP